MNDTAAVELLGVVLGTLLCLAAVILTVVTYRDWRAAETWAEEDVGRRLVTSHLYRLLGKVLIWADLSLLYLSRPRVLPPLRRFLLSYPLTLFFILEGALLLFFINDVSEWIWRRHFFSTARRRAKLRPPMTLERLETLERLDRLLQEEEEQEDHHGETPISTTP